MHQHQRPEKKRDFGSETATFKLEMGLAEESRLAGERQETRRLIVDFRSWPKLAHQWRRIFGVVLDAHASEIIVKSPGQPL